MPTFPPVTRHQRPYEFQIISLSASPALGDKFLNLGGTDKASCFIRSNILRSRADAFKKENKLLNAREMYTLAAQALVGNSIPVSGGRSGAYMALDEWEAIEVMTCFNGVAECFLKLKNYDEALLWLAEFDTLYKNHQFTMTGSSPSFEWSDFAVQIPEHFRQRIVAAATAADVFLFLGNTGAGVHRRWAGAATKSSIHSDCSSPDIDAILPSSALRAISHFKHPDPMLAPKLILKDDKLQLRGSWQKLDVPIPGGSRLGVASFVHEGHAYVFGGEKDIEGPFFRELWRLDLTKLDKWRAMPAYPIPESVTGKLVGYHMCVAGDGRAYLFTGRSQVDYFDLKAGRWGAIGTKYKAGKGETRWPYQSMLSNYSMECVGEKLYVFGGSHQESRVGCNLFLELDLKTREWKRLSGSALPQKADYDGPGPRNYACTWVSKDKRRIYVMYGDADRQSALLNSQMHGSRNAYGYDDMWAWDIEKGRWERKKMLGNTPCPRSEMSCDYNSKLDMVVLFGGYSPSIPTTYKNEVEASGYTYYADTFVSSPSYSVPSSPSTPKWKQVLTRGFPTYRAQARLFSDPHTGKTFLFGGYTNTQFISASSGKRSSRSYGDLWQLKLECPDGWFEGVDLEEEARTAKAGPWKRCFGCGSAGPWKKCGGTCAGRAFFCGGQCLKEGWKEHKAKHNCRKA